MLSVWLALALFKAAPVTAPLQSAQRYVDPDHPLAALPQADASRPAPSAQVLYRADGEIEVQIKGLRMEARAMLDEHGQLLIQCGMPGHPVAPHSHEPESAQ